jgi:thiol-disulfide isomerase/thioredoxin
MSFGRFGLLCAISCWTASMLLPLSAAEIKKNAEGAPPADKSAAEKPANEKSSSEKPAGKPAPAKPPEKFDPTVAPDGTPKELVAFIRKAISVQSRDVATQTKKFHAILKAAEKVLAAKPTDDEREFAVQAKMQMVYLLQDAKHENLKNVTAFAEELKKGGHDKCARIVRCFILQINLRESMVTKDVEKIKKSIGDTVKYLKEPSPLPTDAGLAFAVGQLAERMENEELAIDVYRAGAKAFAADKNPKQAEYAKMFEGIVRRLTLAGQEMKIEGKLVGGEKFDWSKYAGKVVLVNFWATSDGTSVAEIPRIRKYYDFYHGKGFDVVGISCDERSADVLKFVKEKEIPWAIILGGDKANALTTHYGIVRVPTMILVGKDGKVISINAGGPALKEELAKRLGPMEEKKDAKNEGK